MASMLMGRLSACSRAPVARHCAGLGGKRAAAGSAAAAVHRRRGFAEMPTPPPGYRAKLACLDLEGVLIPEVWVNLAERVGVEELKRTTRDEPVYEKLMRYRLDIMKREGLTIHDINAAIDAMEPFPGAPEFVEWLRERYQVIILSDTFYEFGMPFMKKLGDPTLFCHKLTIDEDGVIQDFQMRLSDPKRKAISAFRMLNFTTIATGDSYNDTTMLGAADAGILYEPSQNVIDDFPQFPVAWNYEELKAEFLAADARTAYPPY